jgi:hypothetical protein
MLPVLSDFDDVTFDVDEALFNTTQTEPGYSTADSESHVTDAPEIAVGPASGALSTDIHHGADILGQQTSEPVKRPETAVIAPYKCYQCNPPKLFSKPHQLTTHRRRHNPPFICKSCGRRLQYRKDLTRHYNTVHATTEDTRVYFPCPYHSCEWAKHGKSKGFLRADTLRRHVLNIHQKTPSSSIT